ncbi:Hypothetical predicted protein [Paramuricea clavata]|uniref:Uncharacterized protein n=1 Tax=Paramuricea clavata TaxID=317549 RepID=A0A7D9JEX1_PARCT|nr:Hypothetical predicted protein [Paramuricea clavata]
MNEDEKKRANCPDERSIKLTDITPAESGTLRAELIPQRHPNEIQNGHSGIFHLFVPVGNDPMLTMHYRVSRVSIDAMMRSVISLNSSRRRYRLVLPLTGEQLHSTGNKQDEARLDLSSGNLATWAASIL